MLIYVRENNMADLGEEYLSVRDLGEQGLLQKLQSFCPPHIIGDDGAVLPTKPAHHLVVTTDMLVDGVHFSNLTTSPKDAGWRAATANLSDLAAMGAFPLGITVALGLPGDLAVNWVEQLYQGMSDCLQKYHTPIVGGDIVRSPVTTIGITAFGQVSPDLIIRRCTAQVGDAIVITGMHGASRAGLELLLHPETGHNLKEEEKQALIRFHQRPNPRLDVIYILHEILISVLKSCGESSPITLSGMDSSDGLADAILQICRASQVGAVLHQDKIPLAPISNYWLTPSRWLDYALYGGEDFELVLCLPPTIAQALVLKLDPDAAIIGEITSGDQVILQSNTQEIPNQVLTLSQGFQHFGS
jgi:thiamine-monophosphate kinase